MRNSGTSTLTHPFRGISVFQIATPRPANFFNRLGVFSNRYLRALR
jgi:hypothetical protein